MHARTSSWNRCRNSNGKPQNRSKCSFLTIRHPQQKKQILTHTHTHTCSYTHKSQFMEEVSSQARSTGKSQNRPTCSVLIISQLQENNTPTPTHRHTQTHTNTCSYIQKNPFMEDASSRLKSTCKPQNIQTCNSRTISHLHEKEQTQASAQTHTHSHTCSHTHESQILGSQKHMPETTQFLFAAATCV